MFKLGYLCVEVHVVGDDADVVIEFDLLLDDFFDNITNTGREDQERDVSLVQLITKVKGN